MKLSKIVDLLPIKKVFPNRDLVPAAVGYINGYNDAIDQIGEKEITLNREKLIIIIKQKIKNLPIGGNWDGTRVCYLNEGALEYLADAIIASEGDILECKQPYIPEEAHDKYGNPETWAENKKSHKEWDGDG